METYFDFVPLDINNIIAGFLSEPDDFESFLQLFISRVSRVQINIPTISYYQCNVWYG